MAFPKSIQIEHDLPASLWTVKADAAQLSQVLMNLAVNARDAMPEGGKLSFSAENIVASDEGPQAMPALKAGSYVALSVVDTGRGIPAEIKDRIFEPFVTTKSVGKGTGLGLATTRDIVKAHGGAIEVASQPGRGTEFRIFLPATLTPPAQAPTTATASVPRGNGELVLVADDESAILEMARLALEPAGYRVLSAHDGTEAVALGAEHKLALKLAVLDLEMPFLGGVASQRALHKINPGLKFVQMSGSVGIAQDRESERRRGFAFLQKPFSAEQLLKTVHEVLAEAAPVTAVHRPEAVGI